MKRPNKIVIDARQLGSHQSSGIGVVVQELISNLVRVSNDDYTVITSNKTDQLLPPDADNLTRVAVDFPYYTMREQLSLLKLLANLNCDLVHFTNFNAPVFFNQTKSIVTVYDLIPWLYPSSPRQHNWFHQWLYRLVLKRSCSRASRIITLSNGTKNDIVRHLKIGPDKIDVVPAAVPDRFTISGLTKLSKDILAKYSINSPYFLYVGQWRRHKNLINLLKAFSIFVTENKDTKLVIVGREDPLVPEVIETIKKLRLGSSVIITGYVPDDEIATFYKNAQAFVFPSLYEGFGIPPLEAMSVGTPVLSSNTSVMPEVLGDAALYFNPYDINNIVDVLNKITASDSLRKRLIEKGYKQAKKYSFDRMAKEIIVIYSRVLGQ